MPTKSPTPSPSPHTSVAIHFFKLDWRIFCFFPCFFRGFLLSFFRGSYLSSFRNFSLSLSVDVCFLFPPVFSSLFPTSPKTEIILKKWLCISPGLNTHSQHCESLSAIVLVMLAYKQCLKNCYLFFNVQKQWYWIFWSSQVNHFEIGYFLFLLGLK